MLNRTLSGAVEVTQTPERWEFRPTRAMGWLALALPAVLAGVCFIGGIVFWNANGFDMGAIFGIPMIVFSVQLLLVGVWGWRLRATPLVVDECGRVRYGEQELCTAKSVESVRIVPDPCSDADGHKVSLGLTTGGTVELPGPYFQSFVTREHAHQIAEELAAALKVGITGPDFGCTSAANW